MKVIFKLFGLVLLAFLAGCATMGPVGYQTFGNKPGQALVHIYRESKFAASGVSADVLVDGKVIGTIPNGSFLAAYVKPGAHTIEVKFGALNKLWYKDQKAELTLNEGDRRFVRLDLTITSLTVIGPFANSTWTTGLGDVPEPLAVKEMQRLGLNNNPDQTVQ